MNAEAFIRNFGVEAAVIEFKVNKDIEVMTLTKEGAKSPIRIYFAIPDWQDALKVGKERMIEGSIGKECVEKESTDKENTDEENTDEENTDEENTDEENMD